jgi:hypothetical protein
MFSEAIPGAAVNGVEITMLMTVGFIVLQAIRDRRNPFSGSLTLMLLSVMMGLVAVYLALGIVRGGDTTKALWEVRPYFYLLVCLVLASTLLTDMRSVRPLLWILVAGATVKAAYGLAVWVSVRGVEPRPEAVLAHEESLVFGAVVMLAAALWLFGVSGKLRVATTLLLPIVLLGVLVNNRRVAWLVLALGMLVLVLVVAVRSPHNRPKIAAAAVLSALGFAIYLPLYWDKGGALAQPARAVRSEVSPDLRDERSNQYREAEDQNLLNFIASTRSTGLGFGVPLDYEGLVDLTGTAELLRFVPHNNVLYVWMRTGFVGMVVFILAVASAAGSAARLARSAVSDEVAAFGAIVAAAVMGYAAMGLLDLGFFWFRIAVFMGVLFGAVDALTRSSKRCGDAAVLDSRVQPQSLRS